MNKKHVYIILLLIIQGVFNYSFAQKSVINNSFKPLPNDATFYQRYLAQRKKHRFIGANIFVGQAITSKKNTYIQKQLDPQYDPSIYHSYWPLPGDTLLF